MAPARRVPQRGTGGPAAVGAPAAAAPPGGRRAMTSPHRQEGAIDDQPVRAVLDGVTGRAPVPPAAATLGFEFIDANTGRGHDRARLHGDRGLHQPGRNARRLPRGHALRHGRAWRCWPRSNPGSSSPPWSSRRVSCGRCGPAGSGPTARAIGRRGDIAYIEAELSDSGSALIATASATARVIPLREAPGAP